jgi:integrase
MSDSSIRELPLTWDACEALQQQRRQVKGALVFGNECGEVNSLRSVGHFLAKVAKLAGLRHIHPHVRSCAAFRSSSSRMTMRYAHLAEAIGDDMIQRLAPRPGALEAIAATEAQHMDSTWLSPKSKTAS